MSHRAAPAQTSAETRSVCRSGSGRGFRDVAQRLDLACSFLRIFLRQLCKSNNGLRKSNKVLTFFILFIEMLPAEIAGAMWQRLMLTAQGNLMRDQEER